MGSWLVDHQPPAPDRDPLRWAEMCKQPRMDRLQKWWYTRTCLQHSRESIAGT